MGTIAWRERNTAIANGEAGDMTRWLYDQITGIQHGEVADRFGWCRIVGTTGGSD